MNEETIVAVYDTAAHADAAVRDLEAANVPSGAISRHASTDAGAPGAAPQPAREPGFWGSLFGGQPDHDTDVYDRSLAGGSTVVTVKAPAEHIASVAEILERHNPVDLDDRATGYGLTSGATTTTTQGTVGAAPVATNPTATAGQAGIGQAGIGEEVISLTEEQIAVGKRLVNRGTTRVRRFVVETPVEQDVNLHSERVSIERRPVAAGTTVSDADFKDRVIEVTESDEEAVVGKTAHVREEVVIRKDATDRVETIHDTVRREDVEITKDAGVQSGGNVLPTDRKI